MSGQRPRFAILGTGNSGQAFAADITLKGFPVQLAEVPAFAENLEAIRQKGGIRISGDASNGFAELALITMDFAEAIRGVDIVIIGGSAFAHEPIAKAAAPYFEDGQYVLFTSNFGALRFRGWMQEMGATTDVTAVETMSLIYATRALAPGEVSVIGVKNDLPTACFPASRTRSFLDLIGPVFPELTAADNVLFTSLNNLNPIVHPPMMLFNAGRIEATGGAGWNLYHEGATESVARVMLAMDAERMALMDRIGVKGIPFEKIFSAIYARYNLKGATLSETLRNSPIHSNPSFPAPDTIDTRYLTEDLNFGLAPWSLMGKAWDVPTPTIDAAVRMASVMLGKDFLKECITLNEMGIVDVPPEKLNEWVD